MVEELGDEESITFLYKLTEGACPNSYGFNVAQMAGLPKSVVLLAREKALSCQKASEQTRMLRYPSGYLTFSIIINTVGSYFSLIWLSLTGRNYHYRKHFHNNDSGCGLM